MSSESIQKIHSPSACRNDSFRAAEKSSHHGKWSSRPPNYSTIRGVSSTEPVSTMTISSTHGRMLSRHARMVDPLSRTIMHSERRGRSLRHDLSRSPLAQHVLDGESLRRKRALVSRFDRCRLALWTRPSRAPLPAPTTSPGTARLFSRMNPAKIDPTAHERPAAEMVHERVAGNHRLISRLDRPQTIIVVLEAADAEPLVQEPDPSITSRLINRQNPTSRLLDSLCRRAPRPNPRRTRPAPPGCRNAASICCSPLTLFEQGPTRPIAGSLCSARAIAAASPS